MPAPQIIIDLVERFGQQIDAYKSGSYNETQVRREFLDPFFKALGWDVDNTSGYAEAYKDVVHEDSIKIGGFTKAPDYCFRIGGTRKFFLEAKKPSISIKDDIAPAFQLRRYAWSAKLPLSVLSDFEELAVYDCRIKPSKTDKSSKARTLYFTYDEYIQRWDEIAAIFSREAVLKGSFDKYAQAGKSRKGTAEVDAEFLKEIESWRELLARNIALRNPQLSQRELNVSVQQTIDRLIFLRICEDRGIDEYNRLLSVVNGKNVYRRLCEVFQQADEKYNSGLFHFSKEKDRDLPDELSLGLAIDDKPLKEIIGGLYYPDCPYEFSVLSADILGQVYEQFLGKVIRLTDGHHAVIEDKPEVKKAGGVYYTPTYIVDYIVKNTVGQLLGKSTGTPSGTQESGSQRAPKTASAKKITTKAASSLRILDPACGSGSFLIGAYQYLLEWHRDYYVVNDPQKRATGKNPVLYQTQGGEWKLTTAERRRILINNIYGVDIDPQAVEVTKLSLLLKVLEGESEQTLSRQLKMFHERALPDLDNNIKCGNSLIGPDYYAGHQTTLFDDEERLRVNVFDWNDEFPEIMKSGGFDAVIGNPPYVRMEEFTSIKTYLKTYYCTYEERADFYTYFIERAIQLINNFGLVGMIVSNKFSVAKYGAPLRKTLEEKSNILEITDFAGTKVFKGATVRTFILILTALVSKKKFKTRYVPVPSKNDFIKIEKGSLPLVEYAKLSEKFLALGQLTSAPWQLIPANQSIFLNRLTKDFPSLKQSFTWLPLFGIKTGFNKAFIIDNETRLSLIESDKSSANVIRRILFGKDVKRYVINSQGRYIIYLHPNKNSLHFPAINHHLKGFRSTLEKRAAVQKWYELQQPAVGMLPLLEKPKIVYPIISPEPRFTLDNDGFLINDKLFVLPTDSLFLLGILNSTLSRFFFSSVCARLEGEGECYYEFRAQFVERFPVCQLDISKKSDKACHDNMVELVEAMLSLNKQLAAAKTAHEKTALQRQIDATDRQIDNLVYELYGLTDDEIKIVEKNE